MYRVFYSEDCAMYGVEQLTTDYMGTRYVQVLPPKKTQGARHGQSAYTHYMGVAIRWINELQRLQRIHTDDKASQYDERLDHHSPEYDPEALDDDEPEEPDINPQDEDAERAHQEETESDIERMSDE